VETLKVMITGATGQAAKYLIEELADNKCYNFEIYSMIRRVANRQIDPVVLRTNVIEGDLTDYTSIDYAVRTIQPDWLVNCGAQSHVGLSFKQPQTTIDITGMGVLRILEAVRKYSPKTKILQFSSSEMFGKVVETPQKETTPFNARSPYAASKIMAHEMCRVYRSSYNIWVSCAINFNFEGEYRSPEFVTRKITKYVADVEFTNRNAPGWEIPKLKLGNLQAKRDWSYGRDFADGWLKMLLRDEPDDFVFASGETHTIEEFLEEAFGHIKLLWRQFVEIDPDLYRPAEVDLLLGDTSKAKRILGWEPKIGFKELVKLMVEHDIEAAR